MPKNSEQLQLKPSIEVNGKMPIIQVQDAEKLRKAAEHIKTVYLNHNFSSYKDMRKARTKVNRLNNRTIALQRKYRRLCLLPYSKLRTQIKYILAPTKDVVKEFKSRLDTNKQQRQDLVLNHFKPIFNHFCVLNNVTPFPIPKECLKLSLSKKNRLHSMLYLIHRKATKQKQNQSHDVHGHAIYAPTAEVVGIFKKLSFVGSKSQLDTLLDFAKKQGITLRSRD